MKLERGMTGALPRVAQQMGVGKGRSLERRQRWHGFEKQVARALVAGEFVDELHDVVHVLLAGRDIQDQQVRQAPMGLVGSLRDLLVLQNLPQV